MRAEPFVKIRCTLNGAIVGDYRERFTRFSAVNMAHNMPIATALAALAAKKGVTPAQLAIAWTLQNENVASAIVGASRPQQVTDNVKAAGVTLDADVLKAIDDVVGDVVEKDPAKTQSPRRSEIFG